MNHKKKLISIPYTVVLYIVLKLGEKKRDTADERRETVKRTKGKRRNKKKREAGWVARALLYDVLVNLFFLFTKEKKIDSCQCHCVGDNRITKERDTHKLFIW